MSETIAAICTAAGQGSIGIIRISGDNAAVIADKVFKPKTKTKTLVNLKGYQAAFGHVCDENGVIDECIALKFNAPYSYTGENTVELSIHGGEAVLKQALRAVYNAGAIPAAAGEFTKRAFLNGKMSLNQAEAVMDMISASSSAAARSACAILDGESGKEISEIKEILVYAEAMIAAFTDFPEEGEEEMENDRFFEKLEEAKQKLEKLISDYDKGKIIKNGVECVIIGKPNVGKSTIMNLLSRFDRSIVTSVAGTTRDIIEETVDIGGVMLKLCDTAGIHEGVDEVEKIGIERALEKIKTAGLVLAVVSAENEIDKEDLSLLERVGDTPVIIIVNKTDLNENPDTKKLSKYGEVVFCSAKNGEGIDNLREEILKKIGLFSVDPAQTLIANERQLNCVVSAKNALQSAIDDIKGGQTLDAVGVLIEDAIGALLRLTGENVSETVVAEVFSKFCVGK
ncbi:MAG: tRNA uridine-5-carboxymethylaminomethyl(34) synthesis GTPase MnmE [Acutalibacteraceae bacterium]